MLAKVVTETLLLSIVYFHEEPKSCFLEDRRHSTVAKTFSYIFKNEDNCSQN